MTRAVTRFSIPTLQMIRSRFLTMDGMRGTLDLPIFRRATALDCGTMKEALWRKGTDSAARLAGALFEETEGEEGRNGMGEA